jgi:SRSO17 transposase
MSRTALPPLIAPPECNLAARDVEGLLDELRAYHAHFSPLFARREQRDWGLQYLQGLLSDLPRKSIEPMALALPEGNVRAMQQFIGEGAWDDPAILAAHQRLVAETLGDSDGVLIVDGSDFPKKGTASVGVARQYCGALGKVANCQAGVFLAYASRKGYTLLDHRLYLPQDWFTPAYRPRRRRCGVPSAVSFRTASALAWDMITAVHAAGVLPIGWVTFDEGYGQNPGFLASLEDAGLRYLAEVPCLTRVWRRPPAIVQPPGSGRGRPRKYAGVAVGTPHPQRVDEFARRLSPAAWREYAIKDGAKGVIRAAFAFVRIHPVRNRVPGPESWLVLRRTLDKRPELKYYLSNAPATTPPGSLVWLSGLRWPVERAFQECKGELGMDHYETRTWRGWHHHQTLTILAHHFLVRLRLRLKKNRAHRSASLSAPQRRAPTSPLRSDRGHRPGPPSSTPELRSLPIPP